MDVEDKSINLSATAAIYFIFFVIALGADYSHKTIAYPNLSDGLPKLFTDICFSVLLGLMVVGVTWIISAFFKGFKKLASHFDRLLGDLSMEEIFFIAAFSSLAEELFFRGFLLEKLGLVISSLCFGLLHVGPKKDFLPWTVFAVVMGFFLGATYIWFENIFIPIGIHFTINFVNLMIMQSSRKTH